MRLEIAIDTLQAMIERAQGNLIAISEDKEIEALTIAIEQLDKAEIIRSLDLEALDRRLGLADKK